MVSPQGTGSPVIVEIMDPVAGYQYVLDAANKVAHRMAMGPVTNRPVLRRTSPGAASVAAGAASSTTPAPGSLGRPQISSESLGTKDIDGVLAEGRRMTATYVAGSFGNDRPITMVTEDWFAADLKVTLLSKMSDPRVGERIHKLANLSRAEPDPLLFAPPPDYTVVEETGPFTISIKRP